MNPLSSYNGSTVVTGTLGSLIDNSTALKAKMDLLSQQSSTGLVSQTYGGLLGSADLSLDLRPQITTTDAYSLNITNANTKIDITSKVMDQLQSIASTFFNGTINFSQQTSQEVDTIASQAAAALGQVQSLMNTKIGDNYIFAGEDSSNAPMPDASFNAYVQSIQTAASGLATAGSTATIAATLTAATATSPFSTTLGTQRQVVSVGFGVTAAVGVVAGQNAYATQTGAGTTGSYVRDLIRSLATLSSMNSGQTALGTNFTALVSDTRTNLSNEITAINTENAGLGASQQSLTDNQTALTDTKTIMEQQISGIEDVDAAATASALTQTQTQLQISYKIIASTQSLSLVQYL